MLPQYLLLFIKTMKIAYLGPPRTYSHQAAIQQNPNAEHIPQKSIGSCFTAINDGTVDYALVPFENSTNGQVVFTYDLFRDWYLIEDNLPPFNVVDEQFVSIHHNLITFADKIEDISHIYSHPQVWTQCRKFLHKHELDNVLKVQCTDTSSTSHAVELISQLNESEKKHSAAIASSTASTVHNVPILSSDIEDSVTNTTRFLCLGQKKNLEGPLLHLLAFTLLKHDKHGSLCEVLDCFKVHNLNLHTITTRPLGNWKYAFFVEVWAESNALERCLNDVKGYTEKLVEIGSFKRKE